VEERLFFGSLPDGRESKNGDEEESRRTGHFFVVGREYVGFASCGGNKTFGSWQSVARAKSHCGNNHDHETNFSYCRKKNVNFSRENVFNLSMFYIYD